MMKEFLINKIEEYAIKEGIEDIREIYLDPELYDKACDYADQELKKLVEGGK